MQAPGAVLDPGDTVLGTRTSRRRRQFGDISPRTHALRSDHPVSGRGATASKRAYLDRYAEPDKGWTDRDEARWPVPFWYIDTGMAALLILQTVVDEGLGALYFGIFPDVLDAFREAYGVPADLDPIGAIAIGYDAETEPVPTSARTRARRPSKEVVHYGGW